MGRTVAFLDSQRFSKRLRMIGNIGCSVKLKERMVVVAAYIKVIGRILKDLAAVCIRSHRVITYHIADNSISRITFYFRMISREVRAITVVVLSVCFMNAAVLKHAGSVDHLRNSICIFRKTGHVIRELNNSRTLRIQILSFRHTAAECQITCSVIINHNCRVKNPRYTLYTRSASVNQGFSVRVSPRSDR